MIGLFSACGEIRSGRSMPVLALYFPVLEKGWILRGRLPYWATGLFSTQAVPIRSFSEEVSPNARH